MNREFDFIIIGGGVGRCSTRLAPVRKQGFPSSAAGGRTAGLASILSDTGRFCEDDQGNWQLGLEHRPAEADEGYGHSIYPSAGAWRRFDH